MAGPASSLGDSAQGSGGSARSALDDTLALLVLAIVGASIVLTAAQLQLPDELRTAFLQKNELPFRTRSGLIAVALSGLVLPPCAALLLVATRGAQLREPIRRIAWISSPLTLAWAVPLLLAYRIWYEQPTPYLVFLAAFVLAAEQLLQRSLAAAANVHGPLARSSLDRDRGGRAWVPLVVVLCAASAYALFTGYYSINQHLRFATGAYDLGIYDNLIFNNMHGHFFACPILKPGVNYLCNHAEFGTLFIVPLYALRPGPETLLALQSLCLGGAAVPLYLFASTQLSRTAAALLALAYLLYAPLHGPNFYDFHWIPITVPLWFTLFYAIATRKKWLIALTCVVLLPIREETGVMLAVLGLFLLLTAHWQRLGAVFFVVGVFWFGLMRFVVMPLAGSWWFDNMYADLIPPGEHGFGGVVRTLLTNPAFLWKTLATETKLTYLLHLFAPLAFLPMRRPALLLLAFPGAFFTLLTTNYAPTLTIRFQYTAHWIPWLFAGAVLMLGIYRDRRGDVLAYRAALGTLLVGVLLHSYVYGAILQHDVFVGGFNPIKFAPLTTEERKRLATFERLAKRIPANASVAATDPEAAHIADRLEAYTLRITHGKAEYLLLRGSALAGESRKHANEALEQASYVLIDSGDDLYLFRKGVTDDATKQAFSTLRLHFSEPGSVRPNDRRRHK